MNEYTASNGAKVVLTNAGQTGYILAEVDDTVSSAYLGFEQMKAWREFARAEEDERLGRWRWPENPDYVVYPLGLDADGFRFARATFEPSGASGTWQEGQSSLAAYPPGAQGILAVAAYFDAHPEPKPWESAAIGDVWILTIAGKEHAVTFRRGIAIHMNGAGVELDKVTAGRRIFPEGDS